MVEKNSQYIKKKNSLEILGKISSISANIIIEKKQPFK